MQSYIVSQHRVQLALATFNQFKPALGHVFYQIAFAVVRCRGQGYCKRHRNKRTSYKWMHYNKICSNKLPDGPVCTMNVKEIPCLVWNSSWTQHYTFIKVIHRQTTKLNNDTVSLETLPVNLGRTNMFWLGTSDMIGIAFYSASYAGRPGRPYQEMGYKIDTISLRARCFVRDLDRTAQSPEWPGPPNAFCIILQLWRCQLNCWRLCFMSFKDFRFKFERVQNKAKQNKKSIPAGDCCAFICLPKCHVIKLSFHPFWIQVWKLRNLSILNVDVETTWHRRWERNVVGVALFETTKKFTQPEQENHPQHALALWSRARKLPKRVVRWNRFKRKYVLKNHTLQKKNTKRPRCHLYTHTATKKK